MAEPQQRKNFGQMEEGIVKFWQDNDIFKKSIKQREGCDDFVFYDGPPFVTGLPHHGHILSSTSKDLVGRYKTMRGYRVLRRWGWDCHGLPMENLIEKELKISGRKEIEAYGIDKFNEACEAAIGRYDQAWEGIIARIGRFVDYKDQYKTMDNSFMESVWWGFRQMYDKKLIYQDTRISLYCPRCETPLSNNEVAMDNSYKSVSDPSIFVKFKIKGKKNEYLLVWTTTPWTLPANSAIAVNPQLNYLKVKHQESGDVLVVAEQLVDKISELVGPLKKVGEIKGSDLEGLEYEPLFDFFKLDKKAYYVVGGDFVTTEDGSGLVHIAPSFGDDDYQVGKKYDLAFIETVDSQAKFVAEVTPWAGQNVWKANQSIIDHLQEQGAVLKVVNITHEYPFCYRCETKLIYKTQPAWFVKVSAIKKKMVELNEQINWHPDHLKHGRFQKGLESAPDWNISRSRYWGNPMPVWICDTCEEVEVIESIAELEKKSGQRMIKMHRPWIDEFTWQCKCGKGQMNRIPDVFDCWFESGSMPWASVHYPFENKQYFENNYPAEFITEYIAQTRGWFYNLHVLATAIFGKPSFTNAITTGTILAEDGMKMSKSKGNFTDPQILFEKYGVDSMRYYLMASPLMNAENLNYSDQEQEEIFRKITMLIWNVYTFFATYEGKLGERELKKSDNILDQWILSLLNQTVGQLTKELDSYNIVEATKMIGSFIDQLSTWYLRRSRDRFKNDDDPADQQAALNTMYNVLLTLSKIMAPTTPFIAEELYRSLGGPKESVHLENWPEVSQSAVKTEVLENMQTVRSLIEKALAIRAEAGVKVRQALGVMYHTHQSLDESYDFLLMDEVNVKKIEKVSQLPDGETIKINADEHFKVALDIRITEELQLEGNGRELIRLVNNYRKELGLTPTDMITLFYHSHEESLQKSVSIFSEEIKKSVKAEDLKNERIEIADSKDLKINGLDIWIGIKK